LGQIYYGQNKIKKLNLINKGNQAMLKAQITFTEAGEIYQHKTLRYLWKNRHDKRNPVAYYRPLLKGQIIALKLLKQTA